MNSTETKRDEPRAARKRLSDLVDGYRSTALIYAAASLGIADALAKGPMEGAALATELGADGDGLYRILRGLAAIGVLEEEEGGRFGLTAQGEFLRRDARDSLHTNALLAGEERMMAWRDLAHSARTGETAFEHVFGMSNWDYRRQNPDLNEAFNASIGQRTARVADAVLKVYDFSAFHTIMDVGGGHGALLAGILKAYPALRGILFDQPHVLDGARGYLRANGVMERCTLIGGDFLDELPAGADAQICKSVIHDWDDTQSARILRNCQHALPRGGTLLLVENILPARAQDAPGVILSDVHMLAVTGGRERSAREFGDLFQAAGFELRRVVGTEAGMSVVEGKSR